MAYIKHFTNLNDYFGHILHAEKPGFDRRRKEKHRYTVVTLTPRRNATSEGVKKGREAISRLCKF